MNQLRFAPIIRVSTEQQERQGESLRTQRTQITQYVKQLNGIVPEHCWKYSGQEHATSGFERKRLTQLLTDATKNLFDAVIVVEPSRWSRDNKQSKEGLEILRQNGIRFFVGTGEYNLFDPTQMFFLGVSAEIGELQARTQSMKSLQNRIERAKRNVPTGGKLPFGRTFDKKTSTWGIDKVKQQMIEKIAERYLNGESIPNLAKEHGMNHAGLNRTLSNSTGTEFKIRFHAERLNIDETVTLTVPELLPEDTRRRILERKELNKKYNGVQKHFYLLGKFLYCKHCGTSLGSCTNHTKRRYYVHNQWNNAAKCEHRSHIIAEDIEAAVLLHLFETFGDMDKIKESVSEAYPTDQKHEELKGEAKQLEKDIDSVTKERQRLIQLAKKGILSDQEIERDITAIRERLEALQSRQQVVTDILSTQPDETQVKELSKLATSIRRQVTTSPNVLLRKPYEVKRKLIEQVFSGKDVEGQPYGVWVELLDNKRYKLEIRGTIQNAVIGWERLNELWDKVETKDEYIRYLHNIINFKIVTS